MLKMCSRWVALGICVAEAALASGGLEFTVQNAPPASERADYREASVLRAHEELPESERDALLKRLPVLPSAEGDVLRLQPVESVPVPKPGKKASFTLGRREEGARPAAAKPTLTVLRIQPEGEVQVAPRVAVTFSEPMVTLGSESQALASPLPIRLDPSVPEVKARWISTRTLALESSGALPMATDFTVEIPAEAKAANGAVLTTPVVARFSTPPARVESLIPSPGSVLSRFPSWWVVFDQRVSPGSIAKAAILEVDGKPMALREATDDERKEEPSPPSSLGRAVLLKPAKVLPPDSKVRLVFPPGIPSAEGPRVTTEERAYEFETYAPLKIVRTPCRSDAGARSECHPLAPLGIEFNQPIDPAFWDPRWVQVSPAIPDFRVELAGTTLILKGRPAPKKNYEIRISSELRDVYGQSLGRPFSGTLAITESEPRVLLPPTSMLLLGPEQRAELPVLSLNTPEIRIRASAVEPHDLAVFQEYLRVAHQVKARQNTPFPGARVREWVLKDSGGSGDWVSHTIGLQEFLSEGGWGNAVVEVSPVRSGSQEWDETRVFWVQRTQRALDVRLENGKLRVWLSHLQSGAPVGGVEIRLMPEGKTLSTDAKGSVAFQFARSQRKKEGPCWIEAGGSLEDRVFFSELGREGYGEWQTQVAASPWKWWITTDRKLYRPDEEVQFKGWVRRFDRSDLQPAVITERIEWTARDGRQAILAAGKLTSSSADGSFSGHFRLKPGMQLGAVRIEFRRGKDSGAQNDSAETVSFQVQEFRRPDFEVKASASAPEAEVGGSTFFSVQATAYSGGQIAGTSVRWRLSASPTEFTPAGWGEFHFGDEPIVFRRWGMMGLRQQPRALSVERIEQGQTDTLGRHSVRADWRSSDAGGPSQVTARVEVQDLTRQAHSTSTSVIVHSSAFYAGIRVPDDTQVSTGVPQMEVIVVTPRGEAVAGVSFQGGLERLEGSRWFSSGKVLAAWNAEGRSERSPNRVRFGDVKYLPGAYRFWVEVKDSLGRVNRAEKRVQIASAVDQLATAATPQPLRVRLDPPSPSAGETVRVKILDPNGDARRGRLDLRSWGRSESYFFDLKEGGSELKISLRPEDEDLITLEVSAFTAEGRSRNSGSLSFPIAHPERKLAVTVAPAQARFRPGSQAPFQIEVKDAQKRAVRGAELLVFAVDESLLALAPHELRDPSEVLWARPLIWSVSHSLRNGMLEWDPQKQLEALRAEQKADLELNAVQMMRGAPAPVAAGSDSVSRPGPAIELRKDFRALAFFETLLRTDGQGQAAFTVKLPESVTRFRLFAVAVTAQSQAGVFKGEFATGLPFFVRPSLPRFLNVGDQAEMSVVVQNLEAKDRVAQVAARASGGAEIEGSAAKQGKIPAGRAMEFRFRVRAFRAGPLFFQVAAATPEATDGVQMELPIGAPTTVEAFATYGVLDEDQTILQPVTRPAKSDGAYGGLDVAFSSTRLQALSESWLALSSYPFDCAEQVASRILAVTALQPILRAFQSERLPSEKEVELRLQKDLTRLLQLQREEGNFGLWSPSDPAWPFVTVHATHALVRAKKAGMAVPVASLKRALAALKNPGVLFPRDYPSFVRLQVEAYALSVRALTDDADAARASAVLRELGARVRGSAALSPAVRNVLDRVSLEKTEMDSVSSDVLAWLLPILRRSVETEGDAIEVLRILKNRITETGAAAHVGEPRWSPSEFTERRNLLLVSNRRTDALVLDALIGVDGRDERLAKLVDGILSQNVADPRLTSTQEGVFELLALSRYFAEVEQEEPSFRAHAWLNERALGGAVFQGRKALTAEVKVSMKEMGEPGDERQLLIQRQGKGRLYYRVGLRFAPEGYQYEATDRGFGLERTYEAMDHADDVVQAKDGSWRVRPGARVRVILRLLAREARAHVAWVDPLPAGLEADAWESQPYFWGIGFQHLQFRDRQAEAFAVDLPAGEYELRYIARATTIGSFQVPPARAEEMYAPEIFGRTASERISVGEGW